MTQGIDIDVITKEFIKAMERLDNSLYALYTKIADLEMDLSDLRLEVRRLKNEK